MSKHTMSGPNPICRPDPMNLYGGAVQTLPESVDSNVEGVAARRLSKRKPPAGLVERDSVHKPVDRE
jgi:hypothetical protein